MEPLTKLILNNKIVDMRNSVRQSRIQSINKLVKEIKKLKDKKGTEEQKTKNLNKADRYHECIQIMKKVKDDDVSKFALMNEKSLAQITNNINESPETKAIARIADHRPLYIKVKAFREKYPDWKETLPLLFDTLGEKYQEKKKKGIPKKKKANKNTTKTTENRPKITFRNQKTSNVTYIENTSGTWRVEKIEPSKEDAKPESKVVQNDENKSDIMNKSSCDKPDHLTKNNRVAKSKNNEESRKNNPAEMEEEAIRKENVEEERTKKSSKENENPIGGEKVTKSIDPFFVTKDNKEYLSVNVASNTTNVEDKKADFTPTKFKTDFSKPKSYEKNTKKFNSKIDFPKKYSKIETKEETLHPSWEAKRKQSSMSQFQGKKIKFDD